jgi:hypothetical protein
MEIPGRQANQQAVATGLKAPERQEEQEVLKHGCKPRVRTDAVAGRPLGHRAP